MRAYSMLLWAWQLWKLHASIMSLPRIFFYGKTAEKFVLKFFHVSWVGFHAVNHRLAYLSKKGPILLTVSRSGQRNSVSYKFIFTNHSYRRSFQCPPLKMDTDSIVARLAIANLIGIKSHKIHRHTKSTRVYYPTPDVKFFWIRG